MSRHDVVVIGGGISGLSFAALAAGAGRKVLVLEREGAPGGCLATHRATGGYWFELGAHTCYNSYVGLAGLLDACGLRGEVQPRAKTHLRFLDGDRLVPGSNLGALLRLLSWLEAAVHLPRLFFASKAGRSVAEYYGSLVGKRNYAEVLGPMLSAVPSQSADAFPAEMLFKRRASRREDLPRSFTLRGGLRSIAEALARHGGVELATSRAATGLERTSAGFAVRTAEGDRHEARVCAVATPPSAAAELLAGAAPELAAQAARVKDTVVETLGFAVRASKLELPVSTFLVPRRDAFFSAVTRDSVPDPDWRGFAFHFRPGPTAEQRRERAARVLGLGPTDLEEVVERRAVLPSPVVGHAAVVGEIDRLSAGGGLCVLGNWFAGLSIEDCVERSRAEWSRVAAQSGGQ